MTEPPEIDNRQPKTDLPKTRLHKFLSQAGVTSRRHAEEWIQAGRVTVNGVVVRTVGTTIDPETAEVRVNGQKVQIAARRLTVMLYKPEGYITTLDDPQGRRKVTDLLGSLQARLFPIGRLDYDASGLLLLTNDGELAHCLMHPRFKVAKTYRVTVAGVMNPAVARRLETGVDLDGRLTSPAQVKLLKIPADSMSDLPKTENRKPKTVLELTIREGHYHQVKRMCAAVGHPVLKLKRIAYGPLKLGNLTPGTFRELTDTEIIRLGKACAEN
jgi:23S rRNA pseudouridine2605 synthase